MMASVPSKENLTEPLIAISPPLPPSGNERHTSSSSMTYHRLPPLDTTIRSTITPTLLLALFFQLVHFALSVASLCTDWSRTIVQFDQEVESLFPMEVRASWSEATAGRRSEATTVYRYKTISGSSAATTKCHPSLFKKDPFSSSLRSTCRTLLTAAPSSSPLPPHRRSLLAPSAGSNPVPQ